MLRVGYLVVLVAVCVWSGSAWAVNTVVSDSSKINVLRQYHEERDLVLHYGLNTVAQECFTTSVRQFDRRGASDGGPWNDELRGESPDDLFIHEWYFPGAREIGSWCAQLRTAPGTFEMQYLAAPVVGDEDSQWVRWSFKEYTAGAEYRVAATTYTETPVTAYGIRYIASGIAYDAYFRLNELQVFLTAGQNVSYTDGYNIFTQPDLVTRQWSSPTAGAWTAPNGGDGTSLRNGNVWDDSELKCQNQAEGAYAGRAFVRYELNDQTPITSFTWGGSDGQGWRGNWEIYTCNGTAVDPAELGNTVQDLTANGWVLQYAYTGTTEIGNRMTPADFQFLNPGYWENILVVWDGQFGAMRELEFYTTLSLLPEPATMSLLALGGLALLRRRT